MVNLKKLPLFWILLIAILVASTLPLAVMSLLAQSATEAGIEVEQQNQLNARAGAHAAGIDEQFRKFQVATQLAAIQARHLLITASNRLSDEEIAARLERYQREGQAEIAGRVEKQGEGESIRYDAQNPYDLGVYGLDNWYNTVYLPAQGDNRVSNVFLNNHTALTPRIAYQIAVTEDLDPVFAQIVESKVGTQWVYLTTAEGMMRLYPWAGNYKYPVNWEPQTFSFYTEADAAHNPSRGPVWTRPYNDFARAGIMVTNAVPIYDGDTLIAVMSHDFVIRDIQQQVLGFKVGESGYAFLIDREGNIIAHPDPAYNPENTPLGADLSIKLADLDPAMRPIVNGMTSGAQGMTTYVAPDGGEWLVTYATLPTTGWHLGLIQPYAEILAPARSIIGQLAPTVISLMALVLVISILIARQITLPLRLLTDGAQRIERSADNLGALAAEKPVETTGVRETDLLANVFNQMVDALRGRMNELDSVYAMGQTITSNVEYEKTLQAVLSAVRQVVKFDAGEVAIASGETLTVEAWWGQHGFRDTTGRTQKVGYGLLGLVAEQRAPVFIPKVTTVEDIQRDIGQPNFDGKLIVESGLKSLLGVPLVMGDRLIGAIMLVHREPGHFTEADRRMLIKLSAQASVAISNALQVRQREQALRKQIQELQIEIDEAKKSRQVQEIVDTEAFRDLRSRAADMRSRMKNKKDEPAGEGKPEAEKREEA